MYFLPCFQNRFSCKSDFQKHFTRMNIAMRVICRSTGVSLLSAYHSHFLILPYPGDTWSEFMAILRKIPYRRYLRNQHKVDRPHKDRHRTQEHKHADTHSTQGHKAWFILTQTSNFHSHHIPLLPQPTTSLNYEPTLRSSPLDQMSDPPSIQVISLC